MTRKSGGVRIANQHKMEAKVRSSKSLMALNLKQQFRGRNRQRFRAAPQRTGA
jgi:hypothetical protein